MRACRRGIAYTFQITSIFGNLSAVRQRRARRAEHAAARASRLASARSRRRCAARRSGARAGRARRRASDAGVGARLWPSAAARSGDGPCAGAKLLILDEPTQGLSDAEIAGFCALVREIAHDATVLLIEHNMDVVMQLARAHHRHEPRRDPGGGHAGGDPRQRGRAAGLSRRLMLELAASIASTATCRCCAACRSTLSAGEVLCLLGRNGAGKTTTLKAIMGLVRAARGQHRARRRGAHRAARRTRCRATASPTCRRAGGCSPS